MTEALYQKNMNNGNAYFDDLLLEDLRPHPKNPRLSMREDVIDAIKSSLVVDGFKPQYAIHVRPVDNHFEIISGHHRFVAATQAGLEKIPCWVEEMTDDEAYMGLVIANNQGELLPIEIGKHALEVAGKAQGKKGQGLAAYAVSVGRKETSLREYVNAAKVFMSLPRISEEVKEKVSHLYEISKAPEHTWQLLVDCLLNSDWSVKDTKAAVDRIKSIEIPEFMTLSESQYIEIASRPAFHKTVLNAIQAIHANLNQLKTVNLYHHEKTGEKELRDGREYFLFKPVPFEYDQKVEFIEALHRLDDMLDSKQVQAAYKAILTHCDHYSDSSIRYQPVLTDAEIEEQKKREHELFLINERERLTPVILHGDVMLKIADIRSDSVDLICIDPPYNMDKADWDSFGSGQEFAQWCSGWLKECFRVLKSSGAIYVFGVPRMLSHIQHKMDEIGFYYRNWIAWDTIQGAGGGLWVNRHEDILYYSKTSETFEDTESVKLERSEENVREYKGKEYKFKNPSNVWRFPCVDNQHSDRTEHPTQKPVEMIERIIKASCPEDGKVLDCFMGSGTTGVAAMRLKRKAIGIEINKDYIGIAESRFAKEEIV